MVYEPKAPVIPYKRTCPFDPAAEYARLREEEPISPVTFELAPREKDGWLITRHDHIRQIMTAPRFSHRSELLALVHSPPFPVEDYSPEPSAPGNFVRMDAPEHTRYRRLLTGFFTVRKIQQYESTLERIIDGVLDTTPNMLTLGTFALLEHPEQLAKVRERPELMENTVEELLRYLTISHFGASRVVLEDVEIDGRTIKAGQTVVLSLPSANRDPRYFENADEFDIGRPSRAASGIRLRDPSVPRAAPGEGVAAYRLPEAVRALSGSATRDGRRAGAAAGDRDALRRPRTARHLGLMTRGGRVGRACRAGPLTAAADCPSITGVVADAASQYPRNSLERLRVSSAPHAPTAAVHPGAFRRAGYLVLRVAAGTAGDDGLPADRTRRGGRPQSGARAAVHRPVRLRRRLR
ncbi:cytochrome P450 [Streptomyces tubercidicus]|uniref:Cytochrome P450 n=1 Tax=Streptomyces tubercidicus TaxID=47759 RepID=A0A640V6U9_9ACTN|nr:hypothetical protein Stube_65790 [Streptomyces tubercidicus]